MGQFLYSQCSHNPEFADATLQGAQIKQKSLTATSSAVWSEGALTLKISMIWTRYAADYPRSSCGCHQNSFLFGQGNKQGRLRHSSVCIIHFFNGRDSLSELCKCSRCCLQSSCKEAESSRRASQLQAVPHAAEVAWWFIIIDYIDLQTFTAQSLAWANERLGLRERFHTVSLFPCVLWKGSSLTPPCKEHRSNRRASELQAVPFDPRVPWH